MAKTSKIAIVAEARKGLILGAVQAVVYQYHMGQLETCRAMNSDPQSSQWIKQITKVRKALREQEDVTVTGALKEVLAHCKQTMQISDSEWETALPFVTVE